MNRRRNVPQKNPGTGRPIRAIALPLLVVALTILVILDRVPGSRQAVRQLAGLNPGASVSTQTATIAAPVDSPPEANPEPTIGSDFRIALEKVGSQPDGDLIYGSIQWGESIPYSVVGLDSYRLTDSQGQEIHITQVSPGPNQMANPGSRMVPLAFKIGGPVPASGPLTLTIESLRVLLPVKDARFLLDTNAAQNENQVWPIDQDIQAGAYTIRVESAARLADGYEFAFQAGPEIGCVDIYIEGTNLLKGTCSQGVTTQQFDGEVPAGKLAVVIANLEIFLNGSWQATVNP